EPRWFWAMAKVEPSSLAEATLRPLLIAFCVVVSSDCVALRYCSATSAPVFVLTLKDIVFSIPFWWVTAFCASRANAPRALNSQAPCQNRLCRKPYKLLSLLLYFRASRGAG